MYVWRISEWMKNELIDLKTEESLEASTINTFHNWRTCKL